uniref:TNF receptor-associated factor 7 n=1 Tax=Tokudaia muenninki TaxID=742503 RepID=A0A3G9GY19_9MURI|nr:TNF receptor-associated factor 7 [Tokudaia muenninki]
MSSAKSARYNRFSGGPANLPSSDSSGDGNDLWAYLFDRHHHHQS